MLFNKEDVIHVDIDKQAFHLETCCTVYALPFSDGAFEVVRLSHVLEHLEYPLDALVECKRVATKAVLVKVPNASRTFNAEDQEHIYTWNQHSLKNLCDRVFPKVTIYVLERQSHHDPISRIKGLVYRALFRPNSIAALCYVEKKP